MSTGATGPTTPADAKARSGSATTLQSRAFGLELETDFPISGLPPAQEPLSGFPTTVELVSTAMLDRAWRTANPTRLEDLRDPDGRLVLACDHDDRLGYKLTTSVWGHYLVSADGLQVQCTPPKLTPWRRERILTARVLPLAATLRGLEVFHASAVSLGDAAAAVVGPSQVGKSSVAVNLVLGGASFMTDDLLALEAGQDDVLAHPGAAVMGVREAEYRLIEPEQRHALGRFVQRPGKFIVELEREDRALPLKIVYFLERRRGTRELAIEEMKEPDPRLLLASSYFNRILQAPDRLRAQLDLCSQLSRTAVLCRVSVPPSIGANALAGSLAKHATARLGTRIGP
jgi:hypothetical protein